MSRKCFVLGKFGFILCFTSVSWLIVTEPEDIKSAGWLAIFGAGGPLSLVEGPGSWRGSEPVSESDQLFTPPEISCSFVTLGFYPEKGGPIHFC